LSRFVKYDEYSGKLLKYLEAGKTVFNLSNFMRLAKPCYSDSSQAPPGYEVQRHSTVLSNIQQNNLILPYILFVSSRGSCKQWNCSVVWEYLYALAWSWFSLFFWACVLCSVRKRAGYWAVATQWKMLALYLEQENTLCRVTQAWQEVRDGKRKLERRGINSCSNVFWFVL